MRENIEEIIANPNHHTYVLLGYKPSPDYLAELPSTHLLAFEKALGIDDVRELQDYAIQIDSNKERKIVVVASGMTDQAQNALLKTIEELQDGVCIFLCIPLGTIILDTLLSRVFVIECTGEDLLEKYFLPFIEATPAQRLKIIDEMWDLGEGTRHTTILAFIQNFEQHIHKKLKFQNDFDSKAASQKSIRAVYTARDALVNGAFSKSTLQLFAFAV